MNRILLTLFTLSTLIFTTGCSTIPKYKVVIDAVTAPNLSVAPSSYAIKPLKQYISSNDLIFQQYSNKLAQVLQQKGYFNTQEKEAKQYIYLDYGLDQVTQQTETHVQPNVSFHLGWGGYPFGGYYSPFYSPYYGGSYTTYHKTRNYYNRYVTLLAKDRFNKELWRVDVSSIGESRNLKSIIPLLIEASAPYLGANTAEPIQMVLKENNKNE
jgi:hypothetical protein